MVQSAAAMFTRPGEPARSAGEAPADEICPDHVVPGALEADLDVVAAQLVVAAAELAELGGVGDPAIRCLGAVAVHVRHPPQRVVPTADRTLRVAHGPEVAGGAQQLRMCIAHIGLRERASLVVTEHGAPGQRVVDLAPRHGAGFYVPSAGPPREL